MKTSRVLNTFILGEYGDELGLAAIVFPVQRVVLGKCQISF
jgi:hypothetical protein